MLNILTIHEVTMAAMLIMGNLLCFAEVKISHLTFKLSMDCFVSTARQNHSDALQFTWKVVLKSLET